MSTGTFFLKNSNSGGDANNIFQYGSVGSDPVPLNGHWI
jgi:hypothetical protein